MRVPFRSRFTDTATAPSAGPGPVLSGDPHRVALVIGTARLVLGGAFLAAPVTATRMLGLDTATAKRIGYLSRMLAGRDVALAGGAVAAARADGRPVPWLLAGACADTLDAVALIGALRAGRARGPVAVAGAGGAVLAAAAAVTAVVRRRG